MKIDMIVDSIYKDYLNLTYVVDREIYTCEIPLGVVSNNWKIGDLVSVTLKVVG